MVVFEEINNNNMWLAQVYLFVKKEIYCLRIDNKPSVYSFVQKHKEKVFSINMEYDKSFWEGRWDDKAYDNIDQVFCVVQVKGLVDWAKKVVDDCRVENFFLKGINKQLARLYFMDYTLDFLAKLKKKNKEKIVFVPSNGIAFNRTDGCEMFDYNYFYDKMKGETFLFHEKEKVSFSFLALIPAFLAVSKRWVKARLAFAAVLFYFFFRALLSLLRGKKNNVYELGTNVTSHRQFGSTIQGVGFLLDGKVFTKNNSIFLVPAVFRKYLKNKSSLKDFNFVFDFDQEISFRDFFLYLRDSRFILKMLNKNTGQLFLAVQLLFFKGRWSSFFSRYKIKRMVSHAIFSLQDIVRNIYVNKPGGRSYFYLDSANTPDFFCTKENPAKNLDSFFGFLVYDELIAWSDSSLNHFKDSRCVIEQYRSIGCLWSEHLMAISISGCRTVLGKKSLKIQNGSTKILAVFDTTFHDAMVTKYSDGLAFLKDIKRLLESDQQLFVLFKMKKDRVAYRNRTHLYKEFYQIFDFFEKNENCILFSGGEFNWIDASSLIAVSDLTISFPFTSTTFEALGGRKKAIWHDATGKFRGTFYDEIPGMVTHNYDELWARVNNLLKDVTKKQYDLYLNKYVAGKVENFLDGKAISRFRTLLINNDVDNKEKKDG